MSEETPVEEKVVDAQEATNAFIKEYGELVEKYKRDFASYPSFVPDGQGGFRLVIQTVPVDMSNQPTKSPFIVSENGGDK